MSKSNIVIDDKEVAKILGMSRNWVQIMRLRGGGPPFFRFGNAVRYDRLDVEEWKNARKCRSTSDLAYKQAREADNLPLRPSRRDMKIV